MGSYIRSHISLLLLAILCSLLTPSATSAQVTIEEEIELQEPTTPELSADEGITIQSHRDPKFIVAENDGQLKIYI